jgi:hypothetical protein
MRIRFALAATVMLSTGVQSGGMTYSRCLQDLPYSANVIAFVQTELKKRGYALEVNGKMGRRTSEAIRGFWIKSSSSPAESIEPRLLRALMSPEEYMRVAKDLPIDQCERFREPGERSEVIQLKR